MTELLDLRPADRVLDVGTGSGYAAAVLARLAAHVWSIERHAELSEGAGRALAAAGVANVTLVVGDGTRGLPAQAPFDAINVAATGSLDALAELEDQLAPAGASSPGERGRAASGRRAPHAGRPRAARGSRGGPLRARSCARPSPEGDPVDQPPGEEGPSAALASMVGPPPARRAAAGPRSESKEGPPAANPAQLPRAGPLGPLRSSASQSRSLLGRRMGKTLRAGQALDKREHRPEEVAEPLDALEARTRLELRSAGSRVAAPTPPT